MVNRKHVRLYLAETCFFQVRLDFPLPRQHISATSIAKRTRNTAAGATGPVIDHRTFISAVWSQSKEWWHKVVHDFWKMILGMNVDSFRKLPQNSTLQLRETVPSYA